VLLHQYQVIRVMSTVIALYVQLMQSKTASGKARSEANVSCCTP
jgi:hypothetical protein